MSVLAVTVSMISMARISLLDSEIAGYLPPVAVPLMSTQRREGIILRRDSFIDTSDGGTELICMQVGFWTGSHAEVGAGDHVINSTTADHD